MKYSNKEVLGFLKEIMAHCKKERKTKTNLSNKQLAAKLEITENYLSAIESARAIPSMQVFLRYLLLSGFDMAPLTELEITEATRPTNKARASLIQKIYTLDDDHIAYLLEESKLAEQFNVKIKPKSK